MFNLKGSDFPQWFGYALETLPLAIAAIVLLAIAIKLASARIKRNLPEEINQKHASFFGGLEYFVIIFMGGVLVLELVITKEHVGLSVSIAILTLLLALKCILKDVLPNIVGGALIRTEKPFKVGDRVEIEEYSGTIETLGSHSLKLKIDESTTLMVPNRVVFDKKIALYEPDNVSRETYDIDIGDVDDLEKIQKLIKRTTLNVDDVEAEPGVKALVHDLYLRNGHRSIVIRVSWWVDKTRVDIRELRSNVIHSIKIALDDARIGLSSARLKNTDKKNNISPIK